MKGLTYSIRKWLIACAVVGLLVTGFAMTSCAAHQPPAPVVTQVCPPIPVPPAPPPPRVVLPAKDANGCYPLTQDQVNTLAKGIKDLQRYTKQLEAAVQVYNDSIREKVETPPRK